MVAAVRIARSWWQKHPVWGWGVVVAITGALVVGAFVLPAVGGTATLLPNANYLTTNWTIVGGSATHWQAVSDLAGGNPVDTTYISGATSGSRALFDIAEPPAGLGPIQSVSVTLRAQDAGNTTTQISAVISDGTNAVTGAGSNVARNAWTNYTTTFATDPAGGTWDWSDIATLKVGAVLNASTAHWVSHMSVTITYADPTLTVAPGANRPAAAVVGPNSTVAVDQIALSATAGQGDVTVTGVTVRGVDSHVALQTDVTGVKLYNDVNGNGQLDGGESQIGTTQTFSSNDSLTPVTFSGLNLTVAQGTTVNLLVVYDIGSSAVDGHVVGSRLQQGDISVSTGQVVNTWATTPIDSAGKTIDAAPPTVSVFAPADDAVLSGVSYTVQVSASDAVAGIPGPSSVQVRIGRSDGLFYNGSTFVAGESWLTVGALAGGYWPYSWTLPTGEDQSYTYRIDARATDAVGNTGTTVSSANAATGVKVDTLGPQMLSATAVDANTVSVVFSEQLSGASIAADGSDFTIDNSLTVTAATLEADGITVTLTTSAQTPSTTYTISTSGAGQVIEDLHGNPDRNNTVQFSSYVSTPLLTVSAGADVPAAKQYVLRGSAHAVDQLQLVASNGAVTMQSLVVRGLVSGSTLADVSGVSLWVDDGDNVYEAGEDTQIGTTQSFSGTTATFSGLNYAVPDAATRRVWIVYTFSGTAANGAVFGSQLQDGDITVDGGSAVAFSTSPIVSSAGGQTLEIDAFVPLVSITSPLSGSLTIAQPTTIYGTAVDDPDGAGPLTGSGVASVEVRIGRSDGDYWNGSSWIASSDTWVPSTTYVAGTGNWTYEWALPAGENVDTFTYSIEARGTDAVGNAPGYSPAVTGVRIDTLGPSIASVTVNSATEIAVVFSEPLTVASVSSTDFSFTGGLTASAAVVQGDGFTVLVTTDVQTPGQGYAVQVGAGLITDTQGVPNALTSETFTGFGSANNGALTVTQVTSAQAPDVPSGAVYVSRGQTAVVDMYRFEAAVDDVAIGEIRVTGLDSSSALMTSVSAVSLYADTNGNGLFDEGPGDLIGSAAFNGNGSGTGQAVFSDLNYVIYDGVPQRVWVVYTMGASAADGTSVGSLLKGADGVTVASGTLNGFADITSAASGQTLVVDASPPVVAISSPAAGTVLTAGSVDITGTSSDTGIGVNRVEVRIARSDGTWWDSSTGDFVPAQSWTNATTANAWADWSLTWDPLPADQDGEHTYTISARAMDAVGQYSALTDVAVRVDNTGPAITSALPMNATTVDVFLSEPVAPATVELGDFTIAGLNISNVQVLAGDQRVRLTTDSQTSGLSYTVSTTVGAFTDVAGNPARASSAAFLGYGVQDLEAPTMPTDVAVVAGLDPVIARVTWSASSDNVAVVGYRVFRAPSETGEFKKVGDVSTLYFDDVTGVPGQEYWYKVLAYDAAGNVSEYSATVGPVAASWRRTPHASYSSNTALCRLCHVPHEAASKRNILRDTGSETPGETSLCFACHDGTGASKNIKTGPENSFSLASGHSLEGVSESPDLTNSCSGCHDPHRDYETEPLLPRDTVNGGSITAADNTWCLACHNDTNDWYGAGYPATSSPSRDTTGYPILGTFPGKTVYTDVSVNAHVAIPALVEKDREQGDCLYCHAAHRGPSQYDSLVAEFTVPTAATVLDDQTTGAYASVCFGCHGTTGENPAFGATPPAGAIDIQQFVTSGGPRAGHRIITAGGTLPVGAPLPCFECHNPHGSALGNLRLLSDERGKDLETDTPTGVRAFCFTCHTSSDGMIWNSATAVYEAVGNQILLGLRRDGETADAGVYNLLLLPVTKGHAETDADSCYKCHGSSYDAGGSNVHNPSGGVSGGGEPCYSCHSQYQAYMEDGVGDKVGDQRVTVYHHVMGGNLNNGATYYDGDYAPGAGGTYPSSGYDQMFCVSCHVDHDKFNDDPGANLREHFPPAGTPVDSATNTDFDFALDMGGICTSCHGAPIPKDLTDQKAGTPIAQVIDPGLYDVSAHDYEVLSQYGATSSFRANCSKCHNDEQVKEFQTSDAKFGTHWSASDRLVSAFGGTPTEKIGAQHCYGCHSEQGAYAGGKPDAGFDFYGSTVGAPMALESERVFHAVETASVGGGSKHPTGLGDDAMQCESCHNPHRVTDLGRVSDPDNTYSAAAYGTAAEQAVFCLKCHDGTGTTQTAPLNIGTEYVPMTVVMGSPDDDKGVYAARGHWSVNGAIATDEIVPCGECHDNHGSNAPKLLGEYDATTGTNLIGSTGISANDNTVCFACHTSASTGFPALESARDAAGYLDVGTWPGKTRYEIAYVPATHTGSPHSTAVWPLSGYAAGDCKNCHDVHGTANTYDMLVATFDPTSIGNDQFELCFTCHDGAGAADIKSLFPVSAGGTSSDIRSGHRVLSSVPGATLAQDQALPCYNCHNPHGSASAYSLQVRDIGDGAGEINVSTPGGVRKFCFACHTPQDTDNGWSGTAWASAAGQTVEGISRTGYRLKLPPIGSSGHKENDPESCSSCHANVHSPTGGVSNGGADCYSCHGAFQQYMEDDQGAKTGANNGTVYHHVLGAADGSSDGDKAFASGSYPVSTTDVYCLSCHVDHDKFNASKPANLRTGIGAETAQATDWSDATNSGVCTSCHATSLTKSLAAEKKSDGRLNTPKILDAGYDTSAHKYTVTSEFGAGNTFSASCSKCHNDEQTKVFQSSTNAFSVHWSEAQHILSALGGTVADQLQENHCYRCHSLPTDGLTGTKKSTAGKDWYGTQDMNVVAGTERVYQQFQMASQHPVVAAGGDSVECESCHNPHTVTTGTQKVSDPDNTYTAYTYSSDDNIPGFCLKCHDGALPAHVIDASTYVPYSVTQASTAINNKADATLLSKGHWNTDPAGNGSISSGERVNCGECHDNHGSPYPKLLGAYDPATGTNKINGQAITGENNSVCAACHTSASTSYGAPVASNTIRNAQGYIINGTYPGLSTFTTSKHANARGGATRGSSLPDLGAGDCRTCHDVHGSANRYDSLRMTFDAYPVTANTDYSLCFDCHDGNDPTGLAKNIKTYYPGTVGGSGGGTGHYIMSAGGTLPVGEPVPCYDCHDPHGSASAYGLTVRTEITPGQTIVIGDQVGEILMSQTDQLTGQNVRRFCFTCHTTGNPALTQGWNGSAYVNVSPGAMVEGIDRTIQNNVTKIGLKLTERNAHFLASNQSCYDCHGKDYSTSSSNNVHNPSGGPSTGGKDCYICHTTYQGYMEDGIGTNTGASRALTYHHVLGGNVSAVYYDGDRAFATASYPNLTNSTRTDVFCLSCHVDHNQFNANKGANLRTSITATSPTNTDTGICTSCHDQSLTKAGVADKKSDGRTATPIVAAGAYGTSAHQYVVTSSFGTSTFNGQCVKCHNDENDAAGTTYKDFQTSATKFGPHWSAVQHILSALGGAVTDELQESHCYRCHSRTTDALAGTKKPTEGKDWYGTQDMNVVAGTDYVWRQFNAVGITSKHPVVATGGDSVECESCHNPHVVTTGATKVTDPMNTYTAFTYGGASADDNQPVFCLRCHGNNGSGTPKSLPTRTINGTTYIPYSVTMVSGSTVTTVNDKAAYGSRGHWSTVGAISSGERVSCAECHDNHGSTTAKLLGQYDSASGTNRIQNPVGGAWTTITANNNTVCYACHGAATGTAYTRLSNGYPDVGTWPGQTTYTNATYGIHNKTTVKWPTRTDLAGGDCKNCHDVHGTQYLYDELVGQFDPSSAAANRYGLCFACHDADGPSTKNIAQYYPTGDGGTAPAGGNYGHQIKTAGGTLGVGQGLPCYNCHNPHGSAEPDGLLVETMINGVKYLMGDVATEIGDINTTANNTAVRRFCFLCHTTGGIGTDTAGTGYTTAGTIKAADLVEGLSRLGSNKLPLNTTTTAHQLAQTSNCFDCHGGMTASNASNVHNPSGGAGGGPCLTCHGAGSTSRLDKMVNDTATYHHVLDGGDGQANLTGTDVVGCRSCHVDHPFTNKASNLKTALGTDTATNTDKGVCLGCHSTTRVKTQALQAPVGVTANANMAAITQYNGSAHDYVVSSAGIIGYDDGSAVAANCVKCHDDGATSPNKYQTGTWKVAVHYSAESRIAAALGVTQTPSEENLCYKCHGLGATAGPDGYGVLPNGVQMTANSRNIAAQFAKSSTHPVSATAGVHKADEYDTAAAGWNVGATRHVECEDCHNVHAAQKGITPKPGADNKLSSARGSTPPPIAGATLGVWGVNITGANADGTWTGAGTAGSPSAPTYSKVNSSSYQWQLCLKCHSRYAWTTTPPNVSLNLGNQTGGKQTDVGQDFNAANYAYHPIFTPGKNRPATTANAAWRTGGSTGRKWIDLDNNGVRTAAETDNNGLSNTFIDGWLFDSIVVCTDCHNNNDPTGPSGPHGSTNRWLLTGTDPNVKVTNQAGTVSTPNSGLVSANLCLNCHRRDVYGDNAGKGSVANGTLSRFNHAAMNNSCYDNARLGTQLRWSSCLHCHGGRKDENSYNYGTPPNNTVVQSGAIHGSSMTYASTITNTSYIGANNYLGHRFRNGASWVAQAKDLTATSVGCWNFKSSGAATTDAYSTCTQHGPGSYTGLQYTY